MKFPGSRSANSLNPPVKGKENITVEVRENSNCIPRSRQDQKMANIGPRGERIKEKHDRIDFSNIFQWKNSHFLQVKL